MANRIALELVADANPLIKSLEAADASIKRLMGSASSAAKDFDGATSGLHNMGMGLVEIGGKMTATATALGALGLAAA